MMMVGRILIVCLALSSISDTFAQNVLGIDFGSEFIKLAVVQRSAGVQIVLNEATKRKSQNALSFGETQREFGDTAMVKPHLAITHTRELLGKSAKAELLKIYGPHYFPFEIIPDDERGAVKIKESDRFLSPEVLVAMVLTYAKSLAQAQTKEKVADCVITVPTFFRQFERQAMLDAAAIAGLNVLSLMNDHTAVALKYGTDNNVAEFKEPQNVLFYDMGSTATRVSIVQFSAIPDKESFDKNKTLGQLKVLSVSWDETLGGNALTEVVQDILKAKSKKDPSKNSRAMAKLGVAADKAKVILSANKEAHPSIESFIDDYDYRATIMRAEFEDKATPLFSRVIKPVDDALSAANLTVTDLHKVEMIGAGWRVPKIQEILLAHTKRSILDKTMNGDEAFCFGAALYAASLSTAFRLRKFGVHDVTQFPVSIDFESGLSESVDEEESKEDGKAEDAALASAEKKNIKLFRVGHKMPAKRLLSFKRSEDLTFTVKYDGALPAGTPSIIAQYNISGVPAAVAKYPNASKPKISVSFRLTRSGIVDVDKAEAALEEMVDVEVCRFVKANVSNATSNSTNATGADDAAKAAGDSTEEKATESSGVNTTEGEAGSEKSEAKAAPKEEIAQKVCTMKQEKRVYRVGLKITAEPPVIKPFNASQIRAAKVVLEGYDERESKIRERASAFNALESYIYVTKEKLEQNEELIAVTTKEFRETFTEQLTTMSGWLEEDGWNADTATLKKKLGELTDVGDAAFWRMREMIERPEVVKKATEMSLLTDSAVANVSKERSWLNKSHTEVVTNKTLALREWLENMTAAQAAHPAHEAPLFTRDDVVRRVLSVEDAMKDLLRIRRPLPPPVKKEPKAKKDKKAGSESSSTDGPKDADDKAGDDKAGDDKSADDKNADDKDKAAEGDDKPPAQEAAAGEEGDKGGEPKVELR